MTPDDFASTLMVLAWLVVAVAAVLVWKGIGAIWRGMFGEESSS